MTVSSVGRRRFWPLTLIVGLVCFAISWVAGGAALALAGRWLDIGQVPQATQYVLVLPGGSDTRPYVAAALLKAGFAQEALLLRCKPNSDDLAGAYPPSHEIERRVLVARGVSPERIHVLETQTVTTFSDAECLRTFLTEQSSQTATVVTNDFHTRRARFSFHLAFGKQVDQLHFVSAPTDCYSAANWWRHKRGLAVYGGEFLKLTFYWFRYGWGWIWLAGGGGVIALVRWGGRVRRPRALTKL